MNKIESMEGKKVLITGGLGFIGSNLAHKCCELGAEVTVYDNLDSASGGNRYNVAYIEDSIEVVIKDIRTTTSRLARYLVQTDFIFNCAALTSHSASMKTPHLNIEVNVHCPITLLETARKYNPKAKIVQLGTTTQIGKQQYSPADEDHPEFPTDIYSANKTVSEKYVLIYGNVYQMPVTVIRLPNVYGPRAAIHSPDFGFINYFVGLGLQNKEITIFGSGTQLRNVLYVDDCVSALIMAAQTDKTNGEVFFAVGDEHYSATTIANSIAEHIGGRVQDVEWPDDRKAIEVGDAVISNKKFKSVFDWEPRYDLQKGLMKTKQYFVSCKREYLGER